MFATFIPSWRLFWKTALGIIAIVTLRFLVSLYQIRRKFQRMQKNGLPMPPHHPVLGHLPFVAGIMSKVPADVHGHVLPHQINLAAPDLGDVFYVDTWPFGPPILALGSPDLSHQVTQLNSLPKFHALKSFMRPITGGNDLVTMEGDEWKTWRNIFKPGFSSSHLITLIPDMMKDVSTFCEILRDKAERSELVLMDTLATKLSLDILGRVALDANLDTQRLPHYFEKAVRNQVRWLSFGNEANLFERYHPLRPIMQWWNSSYMARYVSGELDKRFRNKGDERHVPKSQRSKTIVDLALNTYMDEFAPPSSDGDERSAVAMDKTFRDITISQIRTFVFAGHDTTSSTICYAFYTLSKHPDARRTLVAELGRVLGPDTAQARARITESPHLINQLPYLSAVVKETLRVFPPASSTRSGVPGFEVTAPDGTRLPTDGFLVWSNAYTLHHSAKLWPEPEKFLPERWLASEGDPLYPRRGAFRPFEFGPRNCIGQELALLEIKLVLAMTVRDFKIQDAYEEWDMLNPSKGTKRLNGERAYQIISGAAHPSDGLPCRVTLVGKQE